MSRHLRVNPIRCDAYGHCAALLPELIRVDEWGYPIVEDGAVPEHLLKDAKRVVSACPKLALALEQRQGAASVVQSSRSISGKSRASSRASSR